MYALICVFQLILILKPCFIHRCKQKLLFTAPEEFRSDFNEMNKSTPGYNEKQYMSASRIYIHGIEFTNAILV